MTLIVPSYFIADFIIWYEWANYFVFRFDDFLAGDWYKYHLFGEYIDFYYSTFWWTIYLASWPITFPLTLVWWFLVFWW